MAMTTGKGPSPEGAEIVASNFAVLPSASTEMAMLFPVRVAVTVSREWSG